MGGATEVQVLQRKHCASPWRLLAASLVGLAMVAAATTQVRVVPSLSTSSGAAELRSGRRLQGRDDDHRSRAGVHDGRGVQEDLPQIKEGPQGLLPARGVQLLYRPLCWAHARGVLLRPAV